MEEPKVALIILWGLMLIKLIVQFTLTWGKVKGQPSGFLSTSCLFVGYVSTLLMASYSLQREMVPTSFCLIGTIVFLFGFFIRAAALRKLGPYFSSWVEVREKQPLVRDGIYGVIRHPLHLGFFAEALGMAIVAHNPLVLLPMSLLVLTILLRNPEEERVLAAHFSDQWEEYAQEVPALDVFTGLYRSWRRPIKVGKRGYTNLDFERAWKNLEDFAKPRRATTKGHEEGEKWLTFQLQQMGAHVRVESFPFSPNFPRFAATVIKLTMSLSLLGLIHYRQSHYQYFFFLVFLGLFTFFANWLPLLLFVKKKGLLGQGAIGKNIIGHLGAREKDAKTVILMAHYDTVSMNVPMLLVMPLAMLATGGTLMCLVGEFVTTFFRDYIVLNLGAHFYVKALALSAHVGTVSAVTYLLLLLVKRADGSPGALDNGSGVVTVLEVAKALEGEAEIYIVFTDCEELGLLGALHFGLHNKEAFLNENTVVYNLDMPVSLRYGPAFNGSFGFPRPYHTDGELNRLLQEQARESGLALRRLDIPFFSALDHFPLVLLGYRCTGLASAATTIHGESDTLETVPKDQLHAVGDLSVAVLRRWLSTSSGTL